MNIPGFVYKNVNDYYGCLSMAEKLGLDFIPFNVPGKNVYEWKNLKAPEGCNLVTNISKMNIGYPPIVYFTGYLNYNISFGKRQRFDTVTPLCTLWRIKN